MKATENALYINDISKSFGGVQAIRNVSFSLGLDASMVIIGPNGAGKTTLFNLITGEIPVDSGEIFIFGENLTKSSIRKRNELGVTRTYQICNLFKNLSVEQNLFLALKTKGDFFSRFNKKRIAINKVKKIAEKVGLETELKAKVKDLSHGEQRQLELGIVIAPDPKIILFDEPMAGLSPAERVFISKMIRQLAKEKIILVIEHDMDFALSIVDNITVMNQGKILASGTVEQIKNNYNVKQIYKLE